MAPPPDHEEPTRARERGRIARWFGRASEGAASDWTLWQRACQGQASAATELVRRLTPQALGIALQLLRRSEDAEDAVQESFLRLWNSRPSDARGAALATFFNTIVINRCKTMLTQRREFATEDETLTLLAERQQQQQDGGAPTEPGALSEPLRRALQRLPPRQRMALAMWAYTDASVPEIALALELDTNAAHQLLHRAKQALRLYVEGDRP